MYYVQQSTKHFYNIAFWLQVHYNEFYNFVLKISKVAKKLLNWDIIYVWTTKMINNKMQFWEK